MPRSHGAFSTTVSPIGIAFPDRDRLTPKAGAKKGFNLIPGGRTQSRSEVSLRTPEITEDRKTLG